VPEQTIFNVLRLQRFLQEGIVLQIDHANRQIVCSAPPGMQSRKIIILLLIRHGWREGGDALTGKKQPQERSVHLHQGKCSQTLQRKLGQHAPGIADSLAAKFCNRLLEATPRQRDP
jgi:hypothetical protein